MNEKKVLTEIINAHLGNLDSEELQLVLRYIFALEDLRVEKEE